MDGRTEETRDGRERMKSIAILGAEQQARARQNPHLRVETVAVIAQTPVAG